MSILAIEDALIAECRAATLGKVRRVESLPGELDYSTLKRLRREVPGVYVSFAGGTPTRPGDLEVVIDCKWAVHIVTGHASGEAARRRGDALQAGAYELLQVLLPRLHGLVVPGEGAFKVVGVDNLYGGELDDVGVAVYGIQLAIPMAFMLLADPALLVPFETFEAQYDLPPHEGFAEHRKWLDNTPTDTAPDARDTVTLPQT